MKMDWRTFIILIFAGLLAAGFLLHRNRRNSAGPVDVSPIVETRAVNAWTQSVRLDSPAGYLPTPESAKLLEKLQAEERRQQPEKGRN
jgi:hypothetical protein